jgi:hypothetical protein
MLLFNPNNPKPDRAVGNATTLRGEGTQIIAKSKIAPKNLQLNFLNSNLEISNMALP